MPTDLIGWRTRKTYKVDHRNGKKTIRSVCAKFVDHLGLYRGMVQCKKNL